MNGLVQINLSWIFCRQRGINHDLFYAWKHTIKKKREVPLRSDQKRPAGFLPVIIENDPAPASITVTVDQVDVCYHADIDERAVSV